MSTYKTNDYGDVCAAFVEHVAVARWLLTSNCHVDLSCRNNCFVARQRILDDVTLAYEKKISILDEAPTWGVPLELLCNQGKNVST